MKRQVIRLPAQFISSSKKRFSTYKAHATHFVKGRPLMSFLIMLLILLAIIAAGNTIQKPTELVSPKQAAKNVNIYTIGKTPAIKVQAQVQKEGLITIMAQSPGIVQKISVKEGASVDRGTNLISLSTNYQGGNAPSLSRQLAQSQFQNVKDTYDLQKDTIQKQRDLANKNADNTEQLRLISAQSLNDTNSLINLNQDIVNTLNSNLQNLINNNTGGVNDALILAAKQQISTFQSAANQLNASNRNLSYTTNTDNPPTKIANLNHDTTLNQLDIQQKALDLVKDVSQIQLNLARVNESQMFPASPSQGIVQKIHVHPGQSVTPGTPLVTIYNLLGNVTAIARVPQTIAQSVSKIETSNIYIGQKTLSEIPRFVSTEATDSQLYSIVYDIPQEYQQELTNTGYVSVEIPIGHSDSNSIIPFIPLDAVFQTQDSTFVYVLDGEKAASKKIELGDVLGSDVQVKSGLASGDQIILDRNIIAGDSVIVNK